MDTVFFRFVGQRFEYRTTELPNIDRDKLRQEILDTVTSRNMAPIYESVCQELGCAFDAQKLQQMQDAIAKDLESLESKIKDAQENLGEVEVRDALHAKADFLADIMDRQAAGKAYSETEGKTAGAGQKMDLAFALVRLDMALGDWQAVKRGLEHARTLCDKGGDWERKNKLKVGPNSPSLLLLACR